MSDIAIKIEALTKIYKIFDKPTDRIKEALNPFNKRYSTDFFALQNLNIEIKKGETIGIIGKNGAGKSTLLKIITGVLTPSSGTIQVNGRIASLLELGAGFNPEMTGIENIYMNGSIMGYTKEDIDSRLCDIVSFADIGEFINQPVKMYSSGMFARLAFSLNTFVEPDILIIDEALSVGDVFFQNKCFKRMETLKKKGITILFVSHDMGSVKQLCDKCVWLSNGQVEMYDDVKTVSEAYFNEQLTERNKVFKETVDFISDVKELSVQEKHDKLKLPLIKKNAGLVHNDVIIKSFGIYDNDNLTGHLVVEKKYVAKMAVEFKAAFKNIIMGFVVENNKGLNIFAFNTFLNTDEQIINIDSPCTMLVEFEFTLPKIQRGTYIISPAVAQGNQDNHVQLTWLEHTNIIEVDNSGYNLSIVEIDSAIRLNRFSDDTIEYIGE